MSGRERELPHGPTTVWENPTVVIDEVERLKIPAGEVQLTLVSLLHRNLSNVYRSLLAEAHAGRDFRFRTKGRTEKDLYEGYTLEVFKWPNGEIMRLKLSVARDNPLRYGSIRFDVPPSELPRPLHVEVNDRVASTDGKRESSHSARELEMTFNDDGTVDFTLESQAKSSFTLRSSSGKVTA